MKNLFFGLLVICCTTFKLLTNLFTRNNFFRNNFFRNNFFRNNFFPILALVCTLLCNYQISYCQIQSGKIYNIQHEYSGKYIWTDGIDNISFFKMHDLVAGEQQGEMQFKVIATEKKGYYYLQHVRSDKYLCSGGIENGSGFHTYAPIPAGHEPRYRFKIISSGKEGYYYLLHEFSAKYLCSGGVHNGDGFQSWGPIPAGHEPRYRFRFAPVPSSYQQGINGMYTLTSVATKKCLDGNAGKIYPHDPNGGDYQKWVVTPIPNMNNYYWLRSVATGKRLDGNADKIYPHDSNGGDFQKWIISQVPNTNSYWLTSAATGKRLDGNMNRIYPQNPNNGDYQKWVLSPTASSLPPKRWIPVIVSNSISAITENPLGEPIPPDNPEGGDQTGDSDAQFWLDVAKIVYNAIKILNTPRSVEIQIQNFSGNDLTLIHSDHAHGRFIEKMEPVPKLMNEQLAIIGSTSKDWSVGTGTEGSITYRGPDFEFFIHWDNPFIGGNSCSTSISGLDAGLYNAKWSIASGNQHAKAIFYISRK